MGELHEGPAHAKMDDAPEAEPATPVYIRVPQAVRTGLIVGVLPLILFGAWNFFTGDHEKLNQLVDTVGSLAKSVQEDHDSIKTLSNDQKATNSTLGETNGNLKAQTARLDMLIHEIRKEKG